MTGLDQAIEQLGRGRGRDPQVRREVAGGDRHPGALGRDHVLDRLQVGDVHPHLGAEPPAQLLVGATERTQRRQDLGDRVVVPVPVALRRRLDVLLRFHTPDVTLG
jgi:hypothetical protein